MVCSRGSLPNLQLALDMLALHVLHRVAAHPFLNILPIPRQPVRLRTDSIAALRQTLVVALGALIREELLHALEAFLARERGCANRDHGAEHTEAGRQLLDQLVPVFGQPGEEGFDTCGMCAETGAGHVYVLLLNFFAENHGESALDEFRVLGSAENTEGRVFLVGVLGIAVYLENGVVLCPLATIQEMVEEYLPP